MDLLLGHLNRGRPMVNKKGTALLTVFVDMDTEQVLPTTFAPKCLPILTETLPTRRT